MYQATKFVLRKKVLIHYNILCTMYCYSSCSVKDLEAYQSIV